MHHETADVMHSFIHILLIHVKLTDRTLSIKNSSSQVNSITKHSNEIVVVHFVNFRNRGLSYLLWCFGPSVWDGSSDRLHQKAMSLKPGFHYPSWRPELTARVDGWPVSITRTPVNSASGNARPSTRPVLTGNGNRSPVNRQLGPLTRAVNSGSGNRA